MRAHVEWDGYNWIATLDGGGVTQAKRLDQIPGRLAEVAELMHGDDAAAESIELDVKIEHDLGRAAATVAEGRREAEVVLSQLAEDTAKLAKVLRKEVGLSLRDIAKLLDISYQRVGQLVSDVASPRSSVPPKQPHPEKIVGSPAPAPRVKSAAFKSVRKDGMRPAAKASRPSAAKKGGAS